MVVLDSSFLVAFHNRRDAHHAAAAAAMEELSGSWGTALLLEYVFLEVVTVLMARRGHETARRVGEILLEAREVEFVPCSSFFLDSLEVFRDRRPGHLSFTDAAIVAAARRFGADRIATFDADFEGLEGLTIVPDR